MSLKYQNSELFEIHFRINSTGDHTYQKNMHYVHALYTICTIQKLFSAACVWVQLHCKLTSALWTTKSSLNRRWIKSNSLKSRSSPIEKALLSQWDIRTSSSYSELYTKTMYKSIGKKKKKKTFAAIVQSICSE